MKLYEIEKALASFGAENPREEALIIAEELFGLGRAALMADRERELSSPELDTLLEKRKNHIPLQHIIGKWSFMGEEFFVSPQCLIPRPDTEILVEKAIEIIKKSRGVDDFGAKYRVADLCTGSGCIGLSLVMCADLGEMTLVDISSGALEMAKKNALHHGLQNRCRFILGDITKDLPKERFDLIVSNPPYIPTKDIEGLSEEVKKEPMLALDGGCDGLDIIRFLIGDGLGYLKENGAMLIEFGFDQGEIINTLLRQKCDTGSIKSYEILYDYGKNPRVAVIWAN